MNAPSRRMMVVAGEASGDAHAGRLIRALRERLPGLGVFGMGGQAMREAGAEVAHDAGALAVTGLADVPRAIPRLRRIRRELVARVLREQPAAVVLVDYPGFNLALARSLRKLPRPGRMVYFIPPQVWAWWGGRAGTIARNFDLALTIYPFEPDFFTRRGGRAEFVGNPVAYGLRDAPGREAARAALDIGSGERVIALLPGSRMKEVRRHLAAMLGAARILQKRWSGVRVLVSEADALPAGTAALPPGMEGDGVRVVRGRPYEVIRAADAAVVASGTASLETGLLGTPMVVVYAADWLSYLLAKYLLIRVDYLSLVNLLAGDEVARELYQQNVRPEVVAEVLRSVVEDPAVRNRQFEALSRIRAALEGPDPYGRAADRIIRLMETGS